jgi:HK97 family phage portal protein
MGLLDLIERREYSPSIGHPRDPALVEWFGGSRSVTGATVTPDSAFSVMAIYRAVRLLANTMACLPLGVFERLPDGSRRPALKHPLTDIICRHPNRWQTPFGFKQMMSGHLELRGNAYARILSDGRGRVTELIPLHPDRVTPRFGTLSPGLGEVVWFDYRPLVGPAEVILWDEMLHLRGFSQDGLVGISPITVARETIGLALTNREYAARYLSNSAIPGGALSHPKTLNKEAQANLRRSWEERHGSVANVGKVAIFEEGMKWEAIGFNPKDSQFLEQRRFDIEEIARMFDLPPHMLMDLERSTNNNIEHQGIEFVQNAILPRAVNGEETFDRDLLLPSDVGRFYVEYNLDGLQRGDSVARAALYTARFNVGSLSPNDIRRKENENPVEGGDEYFVALNMVPLSRAMDVLTAPPAPTDPALEDPTKKKASSARAARALELRRRIARSHERLFVDALGRVMRKEAQSGRRALEKASAAGSLAPLEAWLTEFYADHEAFTARALEPVIHTAGEAISLAASQEVNAAGSDDETPGLTELLHNCASLAARAHVAKSKADVRAALKNVPDNRGYALDELFTTWESRRALEDGAREAHALARSVADFIYRAAGVPPLEDVA